MLASLFRRITNLLLVHSHAIKSAIQIGDTNTLQVLFHKEITRPLLKDENFVLEAIRAKKLPIEKKQLLLTNLVQRVFSAEGILFDRLVDLNLLTSVVQAGADISCAIEEATLYMLKQALSRGIFVDFNIKDKEVKTPLIMATKIFQSNLIEFLHELRQQGKLIDIDAIDFFGRTALHYACLLGQDHIVDALIKCGADVSISDTHGNTPIKLMRELKQNSPNDFLERATLNSILESYSISDKTLTI